MNLSPHFTLEEMTRSEYALRRGWPDDPNQQEIENLKRTAALLEQVRHECGKPIIVTSGYRSPKHQFGNWWITQQSAYARLCC